MKKAWSYGERSRTVPLPWSPSLASFYHADGRRPRGFARLPASFVRSRPAGPRAHHPALGRWPCLVAHYRRAVLQQPHDRPLAAAFSAGRRAGLAGPAPRRSGPPGRALVRPRGRVGYAAAPARLRLFPQPLVLRLAGAGAAARVRVGHRPRNHPPLAAARGSRLAPSASRVAAYRPAE